MTPNEYQRAALRTDGDDEFYMAANCRLGSHWAGFDKMRLLHASVGLCTEAGELQDGLKKHLFYGGPFDGTNAIEEVGDLLWYAALACTALGTTLEDAMERNIAKLKARYPAVKLYRKKPTLRWVAIDLWQRWARRATIVKIGSV